MLNTELVKLTDDAKLAIRRAALGDDATRLDLFCEALGRSDRWGYLQVKAGMPCFHVGRVPHVRPKDAGAWLMSRRSTNPPPPRKPGRPRKVASADGKPRAWIRLAAPEAPEASTQPRLARS